MHTEESKTLSIKIPRIKFPTLQAGILILLIAVGVLQTVQLYGLNLQISSGQVKAAPSSAAPSSGGSSDSVTSSLPSMVGGC